MPAPGSPRLGPDEERHDEVVQVEPRLAHEGAQPGVRRRRRRRVTGKGLTPQAYARGSQSSNRFPSDRWPNRSAVLVLLDLVVDVGARARSCARSALRSRTR